LTEDGDNNNKAPKGFEKFFKDKKPTEQKEEKKDDKGRSTAANFLSRER